MATDYSEHSGDDADVSVAVRVGEIDDDLWLIKLIRTMTNTYTYWCIFLSTQLKLMVIELLQQNVCGAEWFAMII